MSAPAPFNLQTRPLHPDFGVEVINVDLRRVNATTLYPEIRAAFEQHSVVLFRNQDFDHDTHIRFAGLFGPLEDRRKDPVGDQAHVSAVSNTTADGTIADENDMHVLQLKANQYWHTDSTFLPVPALANILTARVLPSTGGETDFVSTRTAWRRLSQAQKDKIGNAVIWHRYAHSRARISPELAKQDIITMWPDQAWKALWRNPITGQDALYLASHAFKVDGIGQAEGQQLIDRLIAAATRPQDIYSHTWKLGDVMVWDERATMHRGQPWPYGEERTLSSLCVSAGDADGLGEVRA